MPSLNPKQTVAAIMCGFLVMNLVFKDKAFLYCALIVGLAGVLSPWLSEKIDWTWGKLSWLLGEISNRILLTAIYFLVITPVGLIRRLRKSGGLTTFDPAKTSNFTERGHTFQKKDLENTW